MIVPLAITVVPVNLDSQIKDTGVCVRLDLCLHTANRVRGKFPQSSCIVRLQIQHLPCAKQYQILDNFTSMEVKCHSYDLIAFLAVSISIPFSNRFLNFSDVDQTNTLKTQTNFVVNCKFITFFE